MLFTKANRIRYGPCSHRMAPGSRVSQNMAISACSSEWRQAVAFMKAPDVIATSSFLAVCRSWRRGLASFRPTATARLAAIQLCERRWPRALGFLEANGVIYNAALKVCKWPESLGLLDAWQRPLRKGPGDSKDLDLKSKVFGTVFKELFRAFR